MAPSSSALFVAGGSFCITRHCSPPDAAKKRPIESVRGAGSLLVLPTVAGFLSALDLALAESFV
jgi:hypothetical protein